MDCGLVAICSFLLLVIEFFGIVALLGGLFIVNVGADEMTDDRVKDGPLIPILYIIAVMVFTTGASLTVSGPTIVISLYNKQIELRSVSAEYENGTKPRGTGS